MSDMKILLVVLLMQNEAGVYLTNGVGAKVYSAFTY
jgi:hypothetical protein